MAKTKVHGEYLDPSVISGQTQVTAVGADSVLIFDATDNALKKALLSDVIETVGSTPSFTSATISGDLTVDTTTLVVDSSNNKVGIGTASPSAFLTVTGSEGSQYAGSFTNTSSQGWGLFVKGGADSADYSLRVQDKDAAELLAVKSNGSVGIGTASPARDMVLKSEGSTNGFRIESNDENLHFLGAGASSGTGADDGYYAQYSQGTLKTQIWANGDSYFTGGNVGIGNTTPSSAYSFADDLVVGNTTGAHGISIVTQNNTNGALHFTDALANDDGVASYAGYLAYNHASNYMFFGTSSTERMRLTATGGLELGYNGAGRQQANSDALSIITPASGGGQGLAFKRLDSNNDQSLGHISWSNNTQDGLGRVRAKTIGAVNSLGILFETADAGTLAVRCGVRPEGQFVAGNTSLSMPNYPGTVTAHRTGDSSVTDANTWSFNATANGYDRDFGYKASGTGSYAYGVINTGETTWMSRLDFSGAIHLTNTTVQSISDRRLKKDIVDANSQWEDIKGLQFKNFKWKDEERGTGTYLGLIADEVESVSPGLVGIDAITAETMPEDGIDPEYKNVKYSILWMKAAKALQEAMARIETLEAEVKVLKEE